MKIKLFAYGLALAVSTITLFPHQMHILATEHVDPEVMEAEDVNTLGDVEDYSYELEHSDETEVIEGNENFEVEIPGQDTDLDDSIDPQSIIGVDNRVKESSPKIEKFELAKYLSVGESGSFKSEKSEWRGVPIEYDLNVSSSDSSILEVSEKNEYKALKEGKVTLSWTAAYSKDTLKQLEKKWPGEEFPLPAEVYCETVYVTEQKPVYRLYNPNSGEHLFTAKKIEYSWLSENGWNAENSRWLSDSEAKETENVHRVYNPNAGDHHYTSDQREIDFLQSAGWRDEGTVFQACQNSEHAVPVYRLYNPNAVTGAHHFTSSEEEADSLKTAGWAFEGVGFYVTPLRTDSADLF